MSTHTTLATITAAVLVTGFAAAPAVTAPEPAPRATVGLVAPADQAGYVDAVLSAADAEGVQVVTLSAESTELQHADASLLLTWGVEALVVVPVDGDGADLARAVTAAGVPAVVAGSDADHDLALAADLAVANRPSPGELQVAVPAP